MVLFSLVRLKLKYFFYPYVYIENCFFKIENIELSAHIVHPNLFLFYYSKADISKNTDPRNRVE